MTWILLRFVRLLVMELTADEELQAKWLDIVRLEEFEAKKDITWNQATGPMRSFTWVRTVTNCVVTHRLCLRLCGRQSDKEQGVSFLSNSRATDLQDDACTGCTPQLGREVP